MICRKIYETRTHGLCGTTLPGVAINCEHSQTKCSLNCSPQCAGYTEAGSVQTPTAAQKRHNQEFIEYAANRPAKTEPFVPSKITPAVPPIMQNNAQNNIKTNVQPPVRNNASGCGCSGNTAARGSYATKSTASYVR
jgi:hypothetical protein